MRNEAMPRRWALPSELDEEEQAAAKRFGGTSRRERREYADWRRTTLAGEHDDLGLRRRLLAEEVESLRRRAGELRTDALDSMSVEDHSAHLDQLRSSHESKLGPLRAGDEPELPDGGAGELEVRAERLDAERAEIENYGHNLHGEAA
jgi:hypothetical protein